jgi:hypothetical protein
MYVGASLLTDRGRLADAGVAIAFISQLHANILSLSRPEI